ncbi:MAG: hypothetical protein V7K94_28135 [Nostoc sp.]|uniref:hypothetical protein n=1 Tax=Nostoc sp. TaxID=1180 RepID=UPI002FFA25CB
MGKSHQSQHPSLRRVLAPSHEGGHFVSSLSLSNSYYFIFCCCDRSPGGVISQNRIAPVVKKPGFLPDKENRVCHFG